jgi:hypothetical protein
VAALFAGACSCSTVAMLAFHARPDREEVEDSGGVKQDPSTAAPPSASGHLRSGSQTLGLSIPAEAGCSPVIRLRLPQQEATESSDEIGVLRCAQDDNKKTKTKDNGPAETEPFSFWDSDPDPSVYFDQM